MIRLLGKRLLALPLPIADSTESGIYIPSIWYYKDEKNPDSSLAESAERSMLAEITHIGTRVSPYQNISIGDLIHYPRWHNKYLYHEDQRYLLFHESEPYLVVKGWKRND